MCALREGSSGKLSIVGDEIREVRGRPKWGQITYDFVELD